MRISDWSSDVCSSDLGAGADADRTQNLGAGTDDHAVLFRSMALAGDAVRGIGAAQRHILVEGDVIPDLRRLPDHGEAMVDEETLADAGARMNVVAGQETRKMVHGAGQEIKPRPIEAVRHPMEGKRPQARIEEDFGTRTRSREIGRAAGRERV